MIEFNLQPKQTKAFLSQATRLLYGGAVGGGKSFFIRASAILWCTDIQGLQVYLFRKTHGEIIKNHVQGESGFLALLKPFIDLRLVKVTEKGVKFWNGSYIHFCHCSKKQDRWKYFGDEMHVLFLEEAGQFDEEVITFLLTRVRMSEKMVQALPEKYKNCFPRVIAATNPGGPSHNFWLSNFVEPGETGDYFIQHDHKGNETLCQFILATLDDNEQIDTQKYEANLAMLNSPQMYKALRYGDWHVIIGAYFPELNEEYELDPFVIPAHWKKLVGFDWGYSAPFCAVWIAISDGTGANGKDHKVKAGDVVVYRAWYGCQGDKLNEGLRLDNAEIANGIKTRTKESITKHVADPAMWQGIGGPSIAHQFQSMGLPLNQADNARLAGWSQLRLRLKLRKIWFFKGLGPFMTSLKQLQHDETNPEDLDTTGPDHGADALRLVLMDGLVNIPYGEQENVFKINSIGNYIQRAREKQRRRI